jgi:hypothetical protein
MLKHPVPCTHSLGLSVCLLGTVLSGGAAHAEEKPACDGARLDLDSITALINRDAVEPGKGFAREALQRAVCLYNNSSSGSVKAQALWLRGFAELVLRDWEGAHRDLKEALASPDLPAARRREVESAFNRADQHRTRVKFHVTAAVPAKGEVIQDGQVSIRERSFPLAESVEIFSGSYTADVSAPGYVTQRQPVVVPDCKVSPDPSPGTEALSPCPPKMEPISVSLQRALQAQAEGKKPVYKKAWFWGAVGGSAAGVLALGLGLTQGQPPVYVAR